MDIHRNEQQLRKRINQEVLSPLRRTLPSLSPVVKLPLNKEPNVSGFDGQNLLSIPLLQYRSEDVPKVEKRVQSLTPIQRRQRLLVSPTSSSSENIPLIQPRMASETPKNLRARKLSECTPTGASPKNSLVTQYEILKVMAPQIENYLRSPRMERILKLRHNSEFPEDFAIFHNGVSSIIQVCAHVGQQNGKEKRQWEGYMKERGDIFNLRKRQETMEQKRKREEYRNVVHSLFKLRKGRQCSEI